MTKIAIPFGLPLPLDTVSPSHPSPPPRPPTDQHTSSHTATAVRRCAGATTSTRDATKTSGGNEDNVVAAENFCGSIAASSAAITRPVTSISTNPDT